MRGFLAGALTLIALQVFSSSKGPEAGGKLVLWVNSGIRKAFAPDLAAIPNRRTSPPASRPSGGGTPGGGISLPRNPSVTVQV